MTTPMCQCSSVACEFGSVCATLLLGSEESQLPQQVGFAMTIGDVLEFLVKNGPGRTEAELADAIFGKAGYQQRVNQDCQLLANSGRIERRGLGGPTDPFRYYPVGN